MTTPLVSGVPTWQIDTLTIPQAHTVDELGREWIVGNGDGGGGGETGWAGTPAPRTARVDRPYGIGAFRSSSFTGTRVITLSGTTWCPTPALREQTEIELAAVCSDGGRLYTYRRTTDSYDLTCDVERDAETLIKVVTLYRVDWSFQFAAPDPRKHAYEWQDRFSQLSNQGSGGLDPDPGLDPDAGLDAGINATPSSARVGNYGTATAYPILTVTGPVSQPTIIDVIGGDSMLYAGELGPTDTLTINCDPFPARGMPGHGCILNGVTNVRSRMSYTAYPSVPPGGVGWYALTSTNAASSAMTTGLWSSLRSAYN